MEKVSDDSKVWTTTFRHLIFFNNKKDEKPRGYWERTILRPSGHSDPVN